MITLQDLMKRLNEVLENDDIRTGINEIKVSELFLVKLKNDIAVIAKRMLNHDCGSSYKESGVKNSDDSKQDQDYRNYIALNPHLSPDYKEPVKLTDDEKIDFLCALNYTWDKDQMSDKSYINLIKKVCEI